MSKSKIAIGTIIGAVAGLIAGLLTAPKSGKETRADLKSKADELKEEAARRAEEVKAKTGEVATDLRGKADDLKVRGERVVEDAKKGFYDKG